MEDRKKVARRYFPFGDYAKHYSGDNSKEFWERVSKLKEFHGELYSLGCVLQSLEGYVLKLLEDAEKEEHNMDR